MKRIVYILLALFLLVGSLCFVAYYFMGVSFYMKALGYLKNNPGREIAFYGSTERLTYGGVYAGLWMGKVGIWGKGGLRFFNSNLETKYSMLFGCKVSDFEIVESKDAIGWNRLVRIGDYVFVVYSSDNPSLIEQLWGSDFWTFVDKELEVQCLR